MGLLFRKRDLRQCLDGLPAQLPAAGEQVLSLSAERALLEYAPMSFRWNCCCPVTCLLLLWLPVFDRCCYRRIADPLVSR